MSEENENGRLEILNVLDQFGYSKQSNESGDSNLFIDQIFERLQRDFPAHKLSKNIDFGGYQFDILIEKDGKKSVVVECMSKEKYDDELGYLEDLHKEKVLKNSGFEYVRIWSQNVWQNLENELQKINKKLL